MQHQLESLWAFVSGNDSLSRAWLPPDSCVGQSSPTVGALGRV